MSWRRAAGREFAKKHDLPYNKIKTTHEVRRHIFDSLKSSIDAILMRHNLKPTSVGQIYEVIKENWHEEKDLQWLLIEELKLKLTSKRRFKNAMTEAKNDLSKTSEKLENLTSYKRTGKIK